MWVHDDSRLEEKSCKLVAPANITITNTIDPQIEMDYWYGAWTLTRISQADS